jgi:alkanesulfonate monooxygenase SsuD/methylene tetrahydromethanopterin reductase-like flavin-dependent oxidoreductase (luciferase family)
MGIPAVPVATHEFMTAARAQAAALGRPGFDAIYISHPVQDQTRDEIEAKADAAIEQVIARLMA